MAKHRAAMRDLAASELALRCYAGEQLTEEQGAEVLALLERLGQGR